MLPGTINHRSVTFQPPPPHLASLPPPEVVRGPDRHATRPVERRPVEDLFRPVITSDVTRRIRARSGWTIASSCLQGVTIALLATLSTRWVEREAPVIVPVKIVRTAQPPAPPPPPPAAAPAKAPATPPRTPPAKRVVTALVQPRTIPTELKKPDPNEPPEEAWYGDGKGGVVGGVVGLVEAAPAAAVAVAPKAPPPPEKPVRYRSEMAAPVFVAGPPLEYTQAAIEREIEGTMIVECVVDVQGAVHACRVVRGLPFLDRAAVANLEQRRYRPATLDGKALSVTYTFTLNFKLP